MLTKLTSQQKKVLDKCKVYKDDDKEGIWWFDVRLEDGTRKGKWMMSKTNTKEEGYKMVKHHVLGRDVVDILMPLHPFPKTT